MSAAPTFIVVWDGLEKAEGGIRRLQAALKSDGPARRIGLALAHAGLDSVRALTPRQKNPRERRGSTKRGHDPLFKGWAIQYAEAGVRDAMFSAVIKNKAADTPGGAIVLSSVEHGARAHDMTGVFAWFEGSTGVRARSAYTGGSRVELPGGRASNRATRETVDVRFAIAREAGWINLGSDDNPAQIHHPGSPGHGMVAQTKLQLNDMVDVFMTRLAAEYRGAFAIGVQ